MVTFLFTKKYSNLNYPLFYQNHSATSFDLDNQNNIYITGYFAYRLQLHPTDPSFNLISGYKDSFLIKLDSSGNLAYAKKLDVNYTNEHLERVNVAPDGNLNLLLYKGDNQSLSSYGYYIIKINSSNGNEIWRKFLENQYPTELGTDNFGNIVIVGKGHNYNVTQIDVDPSSNTYLIPSKQYLLWLDDNGNFLEAKSYLPPTASPIFFNKITFDSDNNTYVVGEFWFQFDADPSLNTSMLVSTNLSYCSEIYNSAFSIKFDNNRNFVTAFKYGQYSVYCPNLHVYDIKIKNGYQYYVGNFAHAFVDLDPSGNDYTFHVSPINTPYADGYILKLGPCDSLLPNASDNQSFCSSQNPTVSNLYPNSNSYRWYSSLTSTIQLLQTTPLVNGQTYYVSKQIGNCPESARLPVTVTINQSPFAPISTNQIFCEDEYATISELNVTGQNVKWYLSLTDTTSLPINTILQNNTNYYCSQTINGCESDRTLINVTVNSVTLPTLISPQIFCIQQNATLNSIAITGQNIKWYDAQTGGNLLLSSTNLVDGTTYYASQTINSCESLRVPVLINIQNTLTPTGNASQSFCSTQNATLNNISVSGSNIIWYNSATSTTPLPLSTVLANGVTYYATQTINNCESVNRLSVTINLINTLNATNYSETLCDDLNDGVETVSLSNYNANLISNTTGCTFDYYSTLNGATNQISSNQINNSNYNLNLGLNTIYVRITSINTCFQLVQLNLTLVSKPIIPIADIVPLCDNSNVTLNAGTNTNTYLWSTGATTPYITISQTGNYSVTATHNYGSINCSSTKNFVVVLSNAATISQIETVDWTDNQNTITVYLNSSSIGDYEYSIDGVNYQDSNVFSNLYGGIYFVYVRDKNGCGVIFDEVFLLNYPKFFTPNGDGYNDTWSVNFSYFEKGISTQIYDRYGKLIKVLNYKETWDGKYNGSMLPSDDYWFVVNRANGKVYKGHFAMKR
jgi:gliding motility-associated-like protein